MRQRRRGGGGAKERIHVSRVEALLVQAQAQRAFVYKWGDLCYTYN